MKRRLRKGSKKGVFGFLPGRRRDFRVGSDPRGGLVLESLENRLLLSAALEFDHFNIVPNSIEVGGMYEVQYEFHNTGDAANLVISFVDINFYHEDDPSDFESMGSFYLPQVQPGQSSGFQSVWVHTSTVAPMTLPYGPGEYVARAVVARVYSNGPFYDTVTFTQNDTSPPTAELLSMDHVVTEEWGEQYTTMVVKVSDAIEIYGSSSSKSLKIIGPDGSEIPSGSLSGEVISQSNDESEKVIEFRIDAPGYDWDPQDNGTYQVYLKAGSFEDNCDREIPETYLGSTHRTF